MGSRQERLTFLYQRAYELGQELSALLQAPLDMAGVQHVEALLADRQERIHQASLLLVRGEEPPESLVTLMRAVLDQQLQCEALLQRAIDQIRSETVAVQRQRSALGSNRRLIGQSLGANLLNERR